MNWPLLLNGPEAGGKLELLRVGVGVAGRVDRVCDEGFAALDAAAAGGFGAGSGFASVNDQRLPLSPVCGFHVNPGTNMIELIDGPLIEAVPHSVSTVINFTSVAPVMESPFIITTVVVVSLVEANRMPATSLNGILAVPKEVCICN